MTRFFFNAEAEEAEEAEEGSTTGFSADADAEAVTCSNEEADMVADVPLSSSSPFRSVREQKTEWLIPHRVPPVRMPGTAPHPLLRKRRGRTHRPER